MGSTLFSSMTIGSTLPSTFLAAVLRKGCRCETAGLRRGRRFHSSRSGPSSAARSKGNIETLPVLHDVAYDQKTRPWQQVDRMFYDAMRCSGVGPVEAKTFYFELYRHGRH